MADGLSIAQIAAALECNPETIRVWRRTNVEFQTWLREHQAQHAEIARDRLIGLIETAINVLAEVATDPKAPHNHRVAAANSLLDRAGVRPRSQEERDRQDNADLEAMTPAELARALKEAADEAARKVAAAAQPTTQTTVSVVNAPTEPPETDEKR